jgi:hypothetical protein
MALAEAREGSLAQAGSAVARIHGWWEGKLELWRAIWQNLWELKMHVPSVPVILLLGINPQIYLRRC